MQTTAISRLSVGTNTIDRQTTQTLAEKAQVVKQFGSPAPSSIKYESAAGRNQKEDKRTGYSEDKDARDFEPRKPAAAGIDLAIEAVNLPSGHDEQLASPSFYSDPSKAEPGRSIGQRSSHLGSDLHASGASFHSSANLHEKEQDSRSFSATKQQSPKVAHNNYEKFIVQSQSLLYATDVEVRTPQRQDSIKVGGPSQRVIQRPSLETEKPSIDH